MENFRFLEYFGKRLALTIEPNPDGAYLFEVDGREISILDLSDCNRIVVSGSIGHPPPGNKEPLYKNLLEAQYMLKSTSGATFSINPETQELTFVKILVPAVLDNEAFFNEIESFVNALHFWADIVSNYRPEATLEDFDSNSTLSSDFLSV